MGVSTQISITSSKIKIEGWVRFLNKHLFCKQNITQFAEAVRLPACRQQTVKKAEKKRKIFTKLYNLRKEES